MCNNDQGKAFGYIKELQEKGRIKKNKRSHNVTILPSNFVKKEFKSICSKKSDCFLKLFRMVFRKCWKEI